MSLRPPKYNFIEETCSFCKILTEFTVNEYAALGMLYAYTKDGGFRDDDGGSK